MDEKKKLLIVDDEKNIRLMLTQCLNDNYDVDIAVNGEEGLVQILTKEYDLVMLDIKMPGLNGMEVLKRVRDKNINTKIIMMTAYGTVEKAVEAMKLGFVDFISKPFTPNEIRFIVSDVLNRDSLDENSLTSYKDYVEFSKKNILEKNYTIAEEYLKKAVIVNIDLGEPHNLLGVIAEYKKDFQKAIKHYRAALALEPSYEPAIKNLSRITEYRYSDKEIDLGNEIEEMGE